MAAHINTDKKLPMGVVVAGNYLRCHQGSSRGRASRYRALEQPENVRSFQSLKADLIILITKVSMSNPADGGGGV